MYYLKCIDKKRNASNQIVGYVFVDNYGCYYIVNEKSVSGALINGVKNIRTLKKAIQKGSIKISNMQLTVDNKLIDKKAELKGIGTKEENVKFKQLIREALLKLQEQGVGEKESISFIFADLENIIYFVSMYIAEKEAYNVVPFTSVKSKVMEKGNGGSYIIGTDFAYIDFGFKIEGMGFPINISVRTTSVDDSKGNSWVLSDLVVEFKHMDAKYVYSGIAHERTFITVTPEGLKELIDNLNSPRNPYEYIEYKKGLKLS